MRNGAPWSIKGIEREAREMAKSEARKNGMTLGQWLNRVIAEQSGHSEEIADDASKASAGQDVSFDNDVHARMNILAKQLAKLSTPQTGSSELSEPVPDDNDDNENVLSVLHELSGRFEQSERQTAEILSEFKDDLNLITHYIHPQSETAEDVMAAQGTGSHNPASQKSTEMNTMEEALALVVDHIELTDKRNGDVLKSIQSRLSEIGGRMNTIAPSAGRRNHGKVSEMEARVEQLAVMLNQQTGKNTNTAYRELEAKIARLNQDMQGTIQRAQSAPTNNDIERLSQQIQNHRSFNVGESPEFTALQNKIMQMDRQFSQTQAEVNNPPHLKPLNDRIAALSQSLAEVKNAQQPNKAITSLHSRYEELADRLFETQRHIPDIDQVNQIEERLHDLAGRLDKSLEDSDPHPQLIDLETRVNELGAQLESVGEQNRWDDLLPKLDAKFAQINDRLGQTEEKFNTLDGFDGRINELFKGLDQARETAADTAKQAAQQAAQQVAKQVAEQATQQAVQQASQQATEIAQKIASEAGESTKTAIKEAAELAATQAVAKIGEQRLDDGEFKTAFSALERGLDDVRTKTDSVEKRTQETLKTVHDSLEKVVNRLAGLEKKVAEPPEKTAPDMPPQAVATPGSTVETGDLRLPPIGEVLAHNTPSGGDARGLSDNLEQIYGAPQDAPGLERGADMESAYPGSGHPNTQMGGVNRNEDFIAAARRAAQTAAQTPSTGDEADAAAGLKDNDKPSKLGSVIAKNRKSLLYAGIAVLLMGGLYAASSMFMDGGQTPKLAQNMEPAQGQPPAKLASNAPGLPMMQPNPQPATEPPSAMPQPSAAAGPVPVETMTGAPASTNSIPEIGPIATPPKPLHMALGTPARSSVQPKTRGARSTGNLPATLGSQALRGAAVAGNPAAQYEIAHSYATGKGVAKDFRQARIWYQKAASQGLAMAQYRLGTLHEKGQGVPKDLATASTWYKRAAGKGNRKAMHNLAVLNAEGGVNGAKPNFTKAAQWFRRASELGLTDSQFNLAILSERGLGVPQSPLEAYKWFTLAAQNGDKDASNRVETIANQLDSKTLVKARLAVKAWKPRAVNFSANRISPPAGGWANAKAAAPRNTALNDMVMTTQSLLTALGYKPGAADGMMGLNTRQAIMKFQSNEGLEKTGAVSPDLVARLKAASS